MKATDVNFSAAQLRTLLRYDPDTGKLYRIQSKRTDAIREVPEISTTNGYLVVYAMGRLFRWHRVAWALMAGEWPNGDVDHINRNRTDNRWENLRVVSRSENLRNTGVKRHSRTGVKCVEKRRDRYIAYTRINGRKRHLGSFATLAEAEAATRESAAA